jgi:hypothetical protein
VGIIDDLMDPLAIPFNAAVASNALTSTLIPVPGIYMRTLLEYAKFNVADGAVLMYGFSRLPTYHSGGWILKIQTGAEAMTLDTDVFVTPSAPLHLDTYVHEMVHVGQYRFLGKTRFLVSYFGLSAAVIAERFIRRAPLNVFNSSPHEMQAYNLEDRFRAWLRTANPTLMARCSAP